ncbi:MAG: hypothetical protein PHE83_11240 [Opitutaceae bacterium]|nr:hypothetical protein [Opitutaceae bacterium]
MALTTQDLTAYLKKHPIAVGCGVLSVVLLAGLYIRSSKQGELAAQLKEKETQGQKILADIRNGTNLAEQFEALAASIKELESRLVRSSERARNQQYFYRIESDTGVKEISLQPASSSPGPQRAPKTRYTGVGYSVSVMGDYRQILDFVGRLESGQHFYRLISSSVTRQGQRGSPESAPTITLTLNLELLGLP